MQPGEVETPYGIASVFSCNTYQDYNGNGYIEYPQECIGIKNKFHENELINVYMILRRNSPLDDVHYELYDSRGKILEQWSKYNTYGGAAVYNETDEEFAETKKEAEKRGTPIQGEANKLEPGSYKAVWKCRGNLITALDFEVEKE